MDRGTAMLAVVLDVYEGGKDLIPDWKLKEHAESALATGGVEGLRRYYEACLSGSDHRVKTTLEGDRRKTFGIGARALHGVPGSRPAVRRNDGALHSAAGGQVIERCTALSRAGIDQYSSDTLAGWRIWTCRRGNPSRKPSYVRSSILVHLME